MKKDVVYMTQIEVLIDILLETYACFKDPLMDRSKHCGINILTRKSRSWSSSKVSCIDKIFSGSIIVLFVLYKIIGY